MHSSAHAPSKGHPTTHARKIFAPSYFGQDNLTKRHAKHSHFFKIWQKQDRSPKKSKKDKIQLISQRKNVIQNDIVYSNLYFKCNKSLNGVIKSLTDFNQLENNISVCADHFLNKTYLENPHLAVFELRKTIEYRAILRDMYLQYDFELTVPAFRAKCFERYEKNLSSFQNYVPLIQIDNDVYEQYFHEKKWEDVIGRISVRGARKRRLDTFSSSEDLDRISPVRSKLDYEMIPSSERDIIKLSSLSVHELEDVVLKRKNVGRDKRVKIRSMEDVRFSRHYPLLEPLILKDDDYDTQKAQRARIAEHKKIVRITIAYTLAFFILVIVTFFIIYFA